MGTDVIRVAISSRSHHLGEMLLARPLFPAQMNSKF